jgi:ABC-2 type transport system permease protein
VIDTIASEWLKLSTARSTRYALLAVAVVAGALALVTWNAARTWDSLSPEQRAHASIASLPDVEVTVAELCLAIVGILAFTGEHTSGAIRATFAAVPRRAEVIVAKAVNLAIISVITGPVAWLVTFALCRWAIGDRPIGGDLATMTVTPMTLVAAGLATAMFALIGLGLGTITRSSTASLAVLFAAWYLVPIIALNLPVPLADWVGSVVPIALGPEVAGTAAGSNTVHNAVLGQLPAAGVMAAYALLPLAAGIALVRQRDV